MSRCGRCHRPLSNTNSVKRGLGPICSRLVSKEIEEADKKSPLDDHFVTIVNRFIRDAKLDEEAAAYFRKEALKAVADKKKGKLLAKELAYEAVHLLISNKANITSNYLSVPRHVHNMFDLASEFDEAKQNEKYLKKFARKKIKEERKLFQKHLKEESK